MTEKRLPVGRIVRIARLARVGIRSGAGFVTSKEAQGAALQAAELLGNLRGLAAKAGQLASYIDGLVPEAHQEAYARALRVLQDAAPRSSPEDIRAVVESELSAPIGELFSEWNDDALASASLGQVHAARLPDGRNVAVKVQHPGIERAVEADLSNAFVLEKLAGALTPRAMNSRAMLDELALRFREELDYRLEAERQERSRALFAERKDIHVPKVIAERSSTRVLTSELVSGQTLEQAAAAPEELRASWAGALWRFVFTSYLAAGELNVDPHPGNYFFQPDGSVTFIDFGCVLPVEAEHLGGARAMHRAAAAGDMRAFQLGVRQVAQTVPGDYEDALTHYMQRCFAPMLERPYRVTRPYVTEIVAAVQDMKMFAFKKRSRFTSFPANVLFVNRLQVGFYSVLARLDASVDYSAIDREILGRL